MFGRSRLARFSGGRVNQWVMFRNALAEANIHYGKLLLVNRPHQNREQCP
jgi:hypothetical protein